MDGSRLLAKSVPKVCFWFVLLMNSIVLRLFMRLMDVCNVEVLPGRRKCWFGTMMPTPGWSVPIEANVIGTQGSVTAMHHLKDWHVNVCVASMYVSCIKCS